MTWLWLCIIVSMTTVSPELTRSTGGCALSNQPHWVVSSVAGNRCTFLPFGSATVRRFGSGGPIGGTAWVGGAAGGGAGCCARMALPVVSQAPPTIPPAAANAMNPRVFMATPLSPSGLSATQPQQTTCHSGSLPPCPGSTQAQNYQTVPFDSNPRDKRP